MFTGFLFIILCYLRSKALVGLEEFHVISRLISKCHLGWVLQLLVVRQLVVIAKVVSQKLNQASSHLSKDCPLAQIWDLFSLPSRIVFVIIDHKEFWDLFLTCQMLDLFFLSPYRLYTTVIYVTSTSI
jgi:hypothetical protein